VCCSLELGGKSAAIILPDADRAATSERLRYGASFNEGWPRDEEKGQIDD
jgi:acyl-CoA reductase-like NAD-dependent aldehyde dehydrogenase